MTETERMCLGTNLGRWAVSGQNVRWSSTCLPEGRSVNADQQLANCLIGNAALREMQCLSSRSNRIITVTLSLETTRCIPS